MPLSKARSAPTTTTIAGSETRSATEPTTKNVGDSWLELNNENFPLYGWAWRWNGSMWLSPDLQLDYSINTGVQIDHFIHCNQKFNYYFKTLNSSTKVSYPQTPSYFWQIQLWRVTPFAGTYQVNFFDGTTIGQDQNEWRRRTTMIGFFVDAATTLTEVFTLIIKPNAGSSTINAAIQVVYNYARP